MMNITEDVVGPLLAILQVGLFPPSILVPDCFHHLGLFLHLMKSKLLFLDVVTFFLAETHVQ